MALYDDRLEITSTGILPFGLMPEDLTRPHASRPWNPLIAQAFYRRGIIEAWGRGTLKMAELARQAGLVVPEWQCSVGEVIVRFWPTGYVAPTRVGHDLSPLQRQLLDVLTAVGPASVTNVLATLRDDVARRTVQENLALLRHLGLVESSGRGRALRWKIRGAEP